jgi:RNA polymerase sigma-70 factor (ECF subfamily)
VAAEIAPAAQCTIAATLLEELWRTSGAGAYALGRDEFERIVLRIAMARNFGRAEGLAAEATPQQQAEFFASIRVADLVLARACAAGSERAWERFIELYRQPLLRAAIAITGSDTLGRELADGLYAELYGLTEREGERRCPLDSYSGRGSLIGWLRTTLAQRHVDHHRRTHREQPLEDFMEPLQTAGEAVAQPEPSTWPLLAGAVEEAVKKMGAEERFLLASYYLDGRRLHAIAAVLAVHEATVSRKLKRATENIRKQIVRGLERRGLSRRKAEEALGADPRDLTGMDNSPGGSPGFVRLKELLQQSQAGTFKEQADR